jgi:hypothetical protein
MDATIKPQSTNKGDQMNITTIQPARPLKRGFVNTRKILLQIIGILLVAFVAFFSYLATHEGGHLLADALVTANHGTKIDAFKVRVLWLSGELKDGRWIGPVWTPTFSSLARVDGVIPHDSFTATEREIGFMNLMGFGAATLVALIALIGLSLDKKLRYFQWLAVAYVLSVMILDQLTETFISSQSEPLISAVLMGINPILFKGFVTGLSLLETCLVVVYIVRYFRSRRAPSSLSPLERFSA